MRRMEESLRGNGVGQRSGHVIGFDHLTAFGRRHRDRSHLRSAEIPSLDAKSVHGARVAAAGDGQPAPRVCLTTDGRRVALRLKQKNASLNCPRRSEKTARFAPEGAPGGMLRSDA